MTLRKLLSISIAASATLTSFNAGAVHNANMVGVLASVITYTDGDYIYFQLDNQPSTHPTCSPAYFVIPTDVTADRRKALLARLMMAKAMGEVINIGFDNAGDCAHGYIRVHRVG